MTEWIIGVANTIRAARYPGAMAISAPHGPRSKRPAPESCAGGHGRSHREGVKDQGRLFLAKTPGLDF
jgi:hypothetical protein